jgi:hypothetical protein
MFTIIGCLGAVVAEVNSTDEAIKSVLSQIPVGDKKQRLMRNALDKLTVGGSYEVEYGGSGCTVRRS